MNVWVEEAEAVFQNRRAGERVNKDSPQPLSLSHWQPPTPANAACQPACCVPASVPASLYQQDQLAFRLLYNSLTSSLPEVIIQVILLIHCPR